MSEDVISSDTEALVRQWLAALVQVDSYILNNALPGAGVSRVDDISFFAGRSQTEALFYGRMYVNRISNALGVPIAGDYFSQDGYPGDNFSPYGSVNGGLGKVFGLG